MTNQPDDSLIRIGHRIATLRQKRGMTQTQFADAMGTSQSAINRIERGKQNISIEVLDRISDVLRQQVVELSGKDDISFEIHGGKELSGEITINSSKNAAMGLICASLLNRGVTTLRNTPQIEEVNRMLEVLNSIGVKTEWREKDLIITPPSKLRMDEIDVAAAKRTRTVIMLLAPLMHRERQFSLPFAGGCNLGKRTVEPHLMGLKQFGLKVDVHEESYDCTVDQVSNPKKIVAYEPGDTVSENMIMAAALTPGPTDLRFITCNYMVQDVCFFLQQLGVKIEGVGTTNVRVHGVESIDEDIEYSISEDPIEAMTFITAGVVTNSEITVSRVPIRFMELEMTKLADMGLKFDVSDEYKAFNKRTDLVDITVYKHDGNLRAPSEKLHPLPYPGLNADNLPFFAPIASLAEGRTLILDWMYENRAIYLNELNRLGANVELLDVHRAVVNGPVKFSPARLNEPPALRASMVIILTMLAAPGKSTLSNVYSVRRGYESIAARLRSLGADITIIRGI